MSNVIRNLVGFGTKEIGWKIPFDRVLTPLALSIGPQEGTLVVVGFRFRLASLGHKGSLAVLGDIVPQAQPSFGRI